MSSTQLPPSEAIQKILIWHQGGLGDLLLAGPALAAVSRRYPRARLIALGHPERWGLLAPTLPLAAVWDGGEAAWAYLFTDSPLPAAVKERLAPFQLALIFTPRRRPGLEGRLRQAGIPWVCWLPSFPEETRKSVAACQAGHLAELGLAYRPEPIRLMLPESREGELATLPESGPWLAVGPGSGHPAKNWPLAHYYEVTRSLAWQFKTVVIWLAGPAEEAKIPYLEALAAAQGQVLLARRPLAQVAAVLSRCRLYLGGDSGLTHLAAAAGADSVLALFGPTDPEIWAPLGQQVRVLRGPCPQAPCAAGREITCPEPQCLEDLAPDTVLAAAADLLSGG
jgi:heptosyltransferase III